MRLRLLIGAIAAAVLSGWTAGACRAEVTQIRVAHEIGLAHFAMMIVEHDRLIEKHAREAGLGEVKVEWVTMPSATAMVDALLSGAVDVMQSGPPSLLTLWSKTRNSLQVRALSAIDRIDFRLTTRNPAVKTLADFGEHDKIAVPGVKVSLQAVVLEMAAAQQFGPENYAKLDPLTVTMAHSQAAVQMISGTGEVDGHFAGPPFDYQELRHPGIHVVLTSAGVLGEPASSGMAITAARFYKDNPKTVAAFRAALAEAMETIRRDPVAAAKVYIEISKDKDSVENITEIIRGIDYDAKPHALMKYVDFMSRVGSISERPQSLDELFVPGADLAAGS